METPTSRICLLVTHSRNYFAQALSSWPLAETRDLGFLVCPFSPGSHPDPFSSTGEISRVFTLLCGLCAYRREERLPGEQESTKEWSTCIHSRKVLGSVTPFLPSHFPTCQARGDLCLDGEAGSAQALVARGLCRFTTQECSYLFICFFSFLYWPRKLSSGVHFIVPFKQDIDSPQITNS